MPSPSVPGPVGYPVDPHEKQLTSPLLPSASTMSSDSNTPTIIPLSPSLSPSPPPSSQSPPSASPLQPPISPNNALGLGPEPKRRSFSLFVKRKLSGLDGSASSGSNSTLKPATSTSALSTVIVGHDEEPLNASADDKSVRQKEGGGEVKDLKGLDVADHKVSILDNDSGAAEEDSGTDLIDELRLETRTPIYQDNALLAPVLEQPIVQPQSPVQGQQHVKILGSKKLGTAFTKLQQATGSTPTSLMSSLPSSPKEPGASSGTVEWNTSGQEKKMTQGKNVIKGVSIPASSSPKSLPSINKPLPKQPTPTSDIPGTLVERQQLAAKHMRRINHASTVINTLVQVGKLTSGVPFIATINASVQLIQTMWNSVERIGGLEIAAWRLVERCSAILIAVEDSIIALQGVGVDEQTELNLERLKDVLDDSNLIISKLASRSFLKLYLKGEELGGAISKANQNLEDCIVIFQLQASINVAGWRVQSEEDRRKDTQLLLAKMSEAAETDEKMWQALKTDNQSLQETITTIQRTLDAILRIQEEERQYHRAESRAEPPTISALTARALQIKSLPRDMAGELTDALEREVPNSGRKKSFKAVVWATLATGELSKAAGIQFNGNFDQHIHFLKKGLDVLIRRSGFLNDVGVPDWTITALELTHEMEIGSGAYSTVFRGVWHGEKVAIKQLNEMASRKLFLQEVEVWRLLDHPNILPFWGASSTTGPPPYYLISPFMVHSDIVKHLETPEGKLHSKPVWLLEIAQAMQYLHSRDILHGDLKGCNVLISNSGHAIICDFGLAALRLEIERVSGDVWNRRGTFRWAAPELLNEGKLSTATDVYAFAMTAVEILSGGEIPYGHVDDTILKSDVIEKKRRPLLTGFQIPDKLVVLLHACWAQQPEERPSFENIVPVLVEIVNDELSGGPHMGADGLALASSVMANSSVTSSSYRTADVEGGGVDKSYNQQVLSPDQSLHALTGENSSSSASSSPIDPVGQATLPTHAIERVDRVAKSYTNHLEHPFDDRLRIALWEPTPVKLGDIGYLTAGGGFCRIYNAMEGPSKKVELPMRHLDEFSLLKIDSKAVGQRNVAERGLEIVSSALNLTRFTSTRGQTSIRQISRQIKFPLRPHGSRKQSALIVDDAESSFFHTIEPCREYLYRNVDAITKEWGVVHGVEKHDIIIIVGALLASDWAIMTANSHPGSIVNFNVHAQKAHGMPWGTWAIENDSNFLGRGWQADMPRSAEPRVNCKVSSTSYQRDAVLLARLKFPAGDDSHSKPLLW